MKLNAHQRQSSPIPHSPAVMGLTFKRQMKVPVEGQTVPISSLIRMTVEELFPTGGTAGCLAGTDKRPLPCKARHLLSPEAPLSHREPFVREEWQWQKMGLWDKPKGG